MHGHHDKKFEKEEIKVLIGLGNPGARFNFTRHNAGFHVVDEIACRLGVASWQHNDTSLYVATQRLLLVKPQTFMNSSGKVLSFILKKGIKADQILVIHDELEKTLGNVSTRFGGSARGHNGLRSIIEVIGTDFWRLRIGIGRPERKEEVGDYVLTRFSEHEQPIFDQSIQKACTIILGVY